ncbi:uncharacterized protein RCC_12147 [Ramularia collo-cygni]|uniref:Uncharacterized protein n=1 Tax=Ramularia collo-cygni TaxID=112498 RepID=A0A2D3VLH2_9PEZI|nr:uncharacterized protein RCC_12147 [Ramularia collo-cygni]CZT22073.1 uncharacterized protein RCC_12147 [Ramularia collo-cygni]
MLELLNEINVTLTAESKKKREEYTAALTEKMKNLELANEILVRTAANRTRISTGKTSTERQKAHTAARVHLVSTARSSTTSPCYTTKVSGYWKMYFPSEVASTKKFGRSWRLFNKSKPMRTLTRLSVVDQSNRKTISYLDGTVRG